jgi:hypothetical protein
MGAWVSAECPVEGCSYSATFRLGVGAETKGTGSQVALLREEHPNHPADEGDDQPQSAADSN